MTVIPSARLTVIILSFNGMDHLPGCLESIKRQSFHQFNLIVVDNGSTDGSAQYVTDHYPDVTVVRLEKNLGFCEGMNVGIRQATGELVLLLNQDIVLDPECFRSLLNTWDNPPDDTVDLSPGNTGSRPVLGIFPKILFYHADRLINAFGVDWFQNCHWRDVRVGLPDIGGFNQSETVFGSIFPAVLVHRDRFIKIGLFDSLFWSYCEDFDICYRANILGYRFITSPESRILHKYRASSRDDSDPLWSRYWFIRNYLLVFLKNYQLKNLWRYGRHIYRRYLGNVRSNALRTGNLAELKMCRKVSLDLMLRLPAILVRRWRIQRQRKYDDRQFWRTTEPIEEHNIFHYQGHPVLSILALRCGKGETMAYSVDNSEINVR